MSENKEERLWEFKCPNPKCGSKERILQWIADADRVAGRLGEHVVTGAVEIQEFPVTDKKKQTPRPGDEVSVITIGTDICSKCGTKYIFRVLRRVAKYSLDLSQLIHKPPPTTPLPPFLTGQGG